MTPNNRFQRTSHKVRRPLNRDVGAKEMKYIIAILLCWMAGAISSWATNVSGMITNRHGYCISEILVTATKVGDTNQVITTFVEYGESYSIELSEGSWALEIDPVQLNEWGYQSFNTEIEITDTNPVTFNMVPLPIEPPIPPTLSIRVTATQFVDTYAFHLLVVGGGDRVFRVERSTNLTSWSFYDSSCTDNGRIEFGSYLYGAYENRCMFRVIVTE